MDLPGAFQMGHLRHLIESRPMLTRVPDQSLVMDAKAGGEHIRAMRGDGYAFVYLPRGGEVTLRPGSAGGPAGCTENTNELPAGRRRSQGESLRGWWFNPRDGQAVAIGEFPNLGEREFASPNLGERVDWVLVLDDATKSFSKPGLPGRVLC